jgi:predicted transglutaminase-like cysteine proteinase
LICIDRRAATTGAGLALLLLAAGTLAVTGALGYTTSVSERLVEQFAARFGAGARPRLLEWRDFARTRKGDAAAPSLLAPVNGFFNRLPFVSDLAHWGVEDYWATPAEALASNGADCEDFSIAKYFMLKELGVPIGRLRITYVMARRLNQAHMVLAYYPAPDGEPLILDNLEDSVRPASQRTDLVPVYSFNGSGLWLAKDQTGRGQSVGGSDRIGHWKDVQARLKAAQ